MDARERHICFDWAVKRLLRDKANRPDTKAPGLKEARLILFYYSMESAERLAYDRHIDAIMIQNDVLATARLEGLQEGREEGLQEMREEGLQRGRHEVKVSTARSMKTLGLPLETIAQVSGLSIGEIEKI